MRAMKTPLSILDLAPIVEGGDAAQALRHSLDLARHAEAWGYRRYWVAEHHNMDGVASSATAVLVGHIAGGTKTIRVGSGGVMLPNHAPLVIAEQFGTLATLYPGRIDLGLGRAPGTDRQTMRALRRHLASSDEEEGFPRDVVELQGYLSDGGADQPVRAIPGIGTRVPIWLLGSSLYSAQLAAYLGLPFAFASHFAPDMLLQALEVYRGGIPAVGRLARAARDGRRERGRRRQRRRGRVPVHLDPAALSGHAARAARAAAQTDGPVAHSSRCGPRRRRPACSACWRPPRLARRMPCAGSSMPSSSERRPTS